MSIGTKIYTWLYGKFVGKDQFGNSYYCNNNDFNDVKYKRWVIFKGKVEATKIPPEWHAWLHKSIDIPPLNYSPKYEWQKKHEPNLTGTTKAYFPTSHPLSKNYKNENEKKDYESWTP
tara:strand:+ start:521 stop:874 length:354 start_codon:yes stop_codon:yes gene_type:complete